jgi:hypothetical protein
MDEGPLKLVDVRSLAGDRDGWTSLHAVAARRMRLQSAAHRKMCAQVMRILGSSH